MSENAKASSVNRAKLYQLVLFPLNNGATNVYYVLVLSYIATFGSNVLALGTLFASVMVTAMRLCDAITDPIIGALMDRTNGKFGKFRPFMAIGNLIMAVSILVLYGITPTQRLIQSQNKSRFQSNKAANPLFFSGTSYRTAAFLFAQRQRRDEPCGNGNDCRHASLLLGCHV